MDRERDINFLVELNLDRFKHAEDAYGGVFIAFVDEDGGISVEVQEDLDSIIFSMHVEDSEEARAVEALMKTIFKSQGIHTFRHFEDFEREVLRYHDEGEVG
jgi:hypothetical protein